MRKYGHKQGTYTPINMNKYIGKQLPKFRSGWQVKAFIALDRNDKIIQWGSQTVVIPYIDSTRNNEVHRYIVDLFFVTKDINGIEQKWLIQIKPYSQSVPPKATKRKSPSKLLYETAIYQRNHDKWQSAIKFCKNKNWKFAVWTERGINTLS